MLNLAIQHIIHLTRSQRYAIHEGINLVVTGVSIPVWYMGQATSEPAREVFCQYTLSNTKQETPIVIRPNGYDVVLPFRRGKSLDLSDEDYRELMIKNPNKLEHLYQQCVPEVSSKNLLDLKDGGASHLSYREHSELMHEGKKLQLVHFMQIYDIDRLTDTLS